ncbi:hypothetical protein O4J56_02595 [Nocardiopsis sp. RSe5-2]|uniref:Uncharacterized protein n=1 Tax=Nocardiopsis endophytica TaxID=3018445 RepID=A0ABT4TZI6_9ACTN|nr:hypothetical protein [Nocardiopsis endophytica]MDA2809517.1 hypothetical protein [Nocardiopsis endophytica]
MNGIPPEQQMWQAGWESGVDLRDALLSGLEMPRLPFVPVRLEPGEVAHAELVADYSRFYAMDVNYQQSNGFYFGSPVFVAAGLTAQAIGNASARNRAQAMAAPQWREQQRVGVYVTDRRLLALVDGTRWLSWWYEGTMQVNPLLDQWALVELFNDTEPLRWQGPAVPWLSVAVSYLAFGHDHLLHHPELARLSMVEG